MEERLRKLNTKLSKLEDALNAKDAEILSLNTTVDIVKNENVQMKQKLEGIMGDMKKITEQTVKATTDIIVNTLNEQQNKKEMYFERQFNSINEVLLKLTKSSAS